MLLAQLGLEFQIIPADIDESGANGEGPAEHTLRLAKAKALHIATQNPGQWVLGVDTTVEIDNLLLGKPLDKKDAEHKLSLISGREHRVYSSFALMNTTNPFSICDTVKTRVFIRNLTQKEIRWYIESGEPMDKAGAYAAQGIGACLIQRIDGSYTNVVGLPMTETMQALEKIGLASLETS